jgi:hypothetical protein
MKKTTIALFTAAAIGGSSMALAADVTGPSIFGRVDIRAADVIVEILTLRMGRRNSAFQAALQTSLVGLMLHITSAVLTMTGVTHRIIISSTSEMMTFV